MFSPITLIHPLSFFFFFNDTATTEIYTLSLHDALPIPPGACSAEFCQGGHPHTCAGGPEFLPRPGYRLRTGARISAPGRAQSIAQVTSCQHLEGRQNR